MENDGQKEGVAFLFMVIYACVEARKKRVMGGEKESDGWVPHVSVY
jgi:hypothetical protein